MPRLPHLPRPLIRRFLRLFLPAAAVVATVATLLYRSEARTARQSLFLDQEHELEQQQQFMTGDLETAIADLLLLSQQEEIADALAGDVDERQDLAQELLTVLRSKRLYDQVRLLDRQGQEVIRVNYNNGSPRIVPITDLQNKGDRNYFAQAQSLNAGDVYLSPLNLNLEHQVIERPLKPTLRLSMPIFDEAGQLQGALVLNYLGNRLLEHLEVRGEQILYDLQLVDGEGYWLQHRDPEREWGFVLPERRHESLPEQLPQIWQMMEREPAGSFATANDLYTFRSIPVLDLVQHYNPQGRVWADQDLNAHYDWRLIAVTPQVALQQQLRPLRYQMLLRGALAILITSFGAGAIALARFRHQQAQRELARSQQELVAYQEQAQVLKQRISSQIRDSLESDAVIATAVSEIFELIRSDRCTFAWIEDQALIWDVVYEVKLPQLSSVMGRHPQLLPLTEKLTNCDLLRVDHTAHLDDVQLRRALENRGYQAVLGTCVITRSGQVGALLCGVATPYHWHDEEIELLQNVAEQVAIALNQAELYRQAQANAQEAKTALTQLQTTQTQLIHSEKMSSLGQLVAGVAHEINNPANFIHGNVSHAANYCQDLLVLIKAYQDHVTMPPPDISDLLEELDWEFIESDLPQLLDSMQVGTERIREIVRSLRTFSRLDEADQKTVDIHPGIESTLMILGSRLKGQPGRLPITVTTDYDPQTPPIHCYPGLLNQVLMNLLTNAIDALEEAIAQPDWQGGEPAIAIRTHWRPESQMLEIQVQDNGIGINAATQAKLFDPFFTTKPVGSGTGLGLSISYQIIVETHQGALACQSKPGLGTTFTIRLPQGAIAADTAQINRTDAQQPAIAPFPQS
ncbi:MAG: ATP-binding protein [Spirulinaceae cyanobacterium]